MSSSPSFVEFPRAALAGSIPGRLAEITRRHPERIAVGEPSGGLTYAALDRAGNRLARAILAHRDAGPEPVVLLVEHDALAIAAIVGVLKAGKCCAVLDAAYPMARLRSVLEDLDARLIVHAPAHAHLAATLRDTRREVIDAARAPGADDPVELPIDARALAYVSYTTGTTGAPKGVLADHRGVMHRAMTFVNSLGIGPDDRLSLVHGLGVGASFRQLWGGLLSGAAVCPFDLRREGTSSVAAWLDRERITRAHFPASAFRHFASGLAPDASFPAVRSLTVSNEPVFPSDLVLFRRHFSADAVLAVMLGVSEAGNVTQYLIDRNTPAPDDAMPIGHPLPDKEILLLDDAGQPLLGEAVGEIAVRSDFLSPGYWRRPDLNQRVFLPDPEGGARRIYRTGDLGRRRADGVLVHLGRKDAVPKLRGRFVDPLEIERRLVAHPSISDAVVTVREDRPGDQRLVAYIVPVHAPEPSAPELRRFARETLPDHMVPSLFVSLPALPRSANGKVDRLGLPAPGRRRPALDHPPVPARTSIEQELVKIWADALAVDGIGVEDDFFELGGHSLLATAITNNVRSAFGVDLALASLLEAGTVERMATVVVEAMIAAMPPSARAKLAADIGLRDEPAPPS